MLDLNFSWHREIKRRNIVLKNQQKIIAIIALREK